MLRVRIDAHNSSIEPTVASPDPGVEKYLYPIADVDCLCHVTSFAAIHPKDKSDPNYDHDSAVDGPLWIASHITAGQNIDPLQEEDAAAQDEYYADTNQCYSHVIYFLMK